MNIFESLLLDVILITFPILIYLMYLSTNRKINSKNKRLYFSFALFSSFFFMHKYGIDNKNLVSFLILNSIVILSYINEKYIVSNILLILILILYSNLFINIYFYIILIIILNIVYVLKKRFKLGNILFLELVSILISIFYFFFTKDHIYSFKNWIIIILAYIFISNIIYLMCEIGIKIIDTHITFKELQKEKQIRLSMFKITHEIKNPIAVCKGYLDMINVNDQKQVSRYIPIIKGEIERLISLLEDFLLINKNNLDMDIMDLNVLIEDTISKFKPLFIEKKISLHTDLIDDEIFINGDYNRLNQVLINLIKNSIEAMPNDRKGNISISTTVDNNKYYLTIKDNGEGIPESIISKIRNPFFTTKKGGTGLGVSLIYEIIEAHKGTIKYESSYGSGTIVKLEFPLFE